MADDDKKAGGEVVRLALVRSGESPEDGEQDLAAEDRNRVLPVVNSIVEKVQAGEVAILVAATVRQDGTLMVYMSQPGDRASQTMVIGACSSLLYAANQIINGEIEIRE